MLQRRHNISFRKNRFYYYYRLFRWKVLGDRSPIGASIKITQRCNLRCRHCAWEKKQRDDLSIEEWKKRIDHLYNKGVSVIAIEGGEPTLYPYVDRLVEYIKEKGIYCILITNGTTDITYIHPDVFWISIDGMEETHDRIRGRGVFRRVVETIKQNQDKKILSLTTITKSNVDDLEDICSFFSPLLSGLMFNFAYPYEGIEEDTLDAMERKDVARKLIELKTRYPKIINSTSYFAAVGKSKKVHPWLLVTLQSDGTAVQGCLVRHIEEEDCSKCDMGCCAELSFIYDLRKDAAAFWNACFGLPRLV